MPASERLRTALDFSEADLRANRRGECSDAQRRLLERERARQRRNGSIALALVAALAAALALALPAAGAPAWPGVAVGAVAVGVTALSLLWGYLYGADLRRGTVRIVEGPARLLKRRRTYHLKIGDHPQWTVAARHWKAFDEGASYRVAYVRQAGAPLLLSAEELPKP